MHQRPVYYRDQERRRVEGSCDCIYYLMSLEAVCSVPRRVGNFQDTQRVMLEGGPDAAIRSTRLSFRGFRSRNHNTILISQPTPLKRRRVSTSRRCYENFPSCLVSWFYLANRLQNKVNTTTNMPYSSSTLIGDTP